MRLLILTCFLFAFSSKGFSQVVNRYTQPTPPAQYSPMTFDELLFAPKVKSKKYEQNLQRLKLIYSKALGYTEIYIDDFDEQFKNDMLIFASEFDQIVKGDLSTKDSEIQKLEYQFQRMSKNFEARRLLSPKDLKSSDRTYAANEEIPINNYLFFQNGTSVYNSDEMMGNSPSGEVLGQLNGTRVFVLTKSSSVFYKIKIGNKIGFIQTKFEKE